MFKDNSTDEPISNGNLTDVVPELLYSEIQKSWLFAAVAMGTLIGTIPLTLLTPIWGMKIIFTIYGLISAGATLIFPLMVPFGFGAVFILRFFQGVAVATSWPAMGAIIAEWATLRKSGTFVAWLSAHLQLAQIFTMPVAGELCESEWSWPALYYLQGTATVICFAIFWWFFEDSPTIHRHVSEKELKTLQKNKLVLIGADNDNHKIPYKEILTDRSVIGILLSLFGATLGFQFFYQYGPVYLNQVQGLDIQNTGFSAAFPFVISMVVKFIVGPFSDNIPYVGDKGRVIIFASVSLYSMGACFITLAFLSAEQKILSRVFFTAAIVSSGMNSVGVSKSCQLISGRFIHFMMALNMVITSVIVLLIPLMVAVFAPNGTAGEWAALFIATGIIVITFTTIFNFTAEAKLRPWAVTSPPSTTEDKGYGNEQYTVPSIAQLNVEALENGEETPKTGDSKRVDEKNDEIPVFTV
ncbi:unnamed protein product [Bursaphelenchus xylophilus]|uniref:(pine wood nematode) hypothetical protein n=1 Tax=Bursaphelenchus xylophilus TaxID=6326 RepID=A0A1I7S7X0_BURXY|nr:unnamed protein product [Bursaphelenchus xylophilus]CAG9087171.1 unnamed protein product [Bursaphelenchus xylophilus]